VGRTREPNVTRWGLVLAVASALLGTACGDDGSDESGASRDGSVPLLDAGPDMDAVIGSDGGVAPQGDGSVRPTADSLYLVPAVIEQGESGQTYLNLSKTFDTTTVIDPKRGREVQGWNYPLTFEGSVFVADSSAPTLTKHSVAADGTLKAEQTVSFAGVGVTESPSSDVLYFVSSEKAYMFDTASLRAIVWNPKTMTLTGKQFTFPTLARPGLKTSVRSDPYQAVRRGNDLFLPVGWYDQNYKDRFVQALLIIDTTTDEVRGFIEDERCGDGFSTIKSATDDIYVFPSAGGGLQFFVNAETPRPSCVLRVRAGEYTFDPAFKLDLSALVGNAAAQGALPDKTRRGFFFGSYDKSLAVGDAKNFWRLHYYDLTTNALQPVQGDATAWSGAMRYYQLGDRTVAARWTWNKSFEATTYVELPGGPTVTKLFSIAAAGTTISQVR